jgi:1-acyl-sn-glycerol-3-phosphate acyltransferase
MRSVIAAIKVTAYLVLTFSCIPVQIALLRFAPNLNPYKFPQWYHRLCCRIFAIKVTIEGTPVRDKQVVYISNHTSYLDIPVIASTLQTAFVAKLDVASWPLFGTLGRLQRTLFISRARTAIGKEKDSFENRLKEPLPLVLFAEGTSTIGERIKPFKSSLFEVFLNKDITIQPMTISIMEIDGKKVVSDAQREIFGWGDVEIPEHLWRFSKTKGCVIKLTFQKPLSTHSYFDRKRLSTDCYDLVLQGLDLSPEAIYGAQQLQESARRHA